MPRYHFEIVDGHTLPDPTGVDCADDEAAAKQAKAVADQIAEDLPGNKAKRHVNVTDDNGRKVVSVIVGELSAETGG